MHKTGRILRALRLRLAGAGRDDGFSLIEVIVAIGVLFIVMTALVYSVTQGSLDIASARQRQSANGLANRIVEQVRGLAYQKVEYGLADSELAGDANIVDCSGTYRLTSCSGEDVVHTAGLPVTPPLVPHTGTFGPPEYPTTYSWAVYVTRAADAPAAGAYRITAIITWDKGAGRAGASTTVQNQTLVHSPNGGTGCTALSTHPFIAPCEPFFYGTAAAGTPAAPLTSVTIEGTVTGLDFARAVLRGPEADAGANLEQVKRIDGRVTAGQIELQSSSDTTTKGGETASSHADDANTGSPQYDSQPVSGGGTETVQQSAGTTVLTLSRAGGNTGSATSAVAAAAVTPCPPGPNPPTQIDGAPCGYADAANSGAVAAQLLVSPLLGIPISTTLAGASLFGGLTAGSAAVDRITNTTDEGQLQVATARVLSQLDLLGTSAVALPGWGGFYVRLSGHAAQATATVGPNSSVPSVTQAGTVSFWNGLGYSSVSVTGTATPITVAPVDTTLGLVTISMSASLSVGGSSTTEVIQPVGTQTRTAAEAKALPALSGTVNYRIANLTGDVVNLTLTVDTGTLTASATYRPA